MLSPLRELEVWIDIAPVPNLGYKEAPSLSAPLLQVEGIREPVYERNPAFPINMIEAFVVSTFIGI